VGLLTVLADAGRVHDALRGYREVVDYFARTGNWTGTTLRKLADVLRRLGDNEAGHGPRRRRRAGLVERRGGPTRKPPGGPGGR
jgi:hypothetical protein